MKTTAAIFVLALLSSCSATEKFWGNGSCEKDQRSAISSRGQPEDVISHSGDGWSSETYYWWSKGRSTTYRWGRNYDGCVRTHSTFTPI